MRQTMHDHAVTISAAVGIAASVISVLTPLTILPLSLPPYIISIAQTILLAIVGGSVSYWTQYIWRKRETRRRKEIEKPLGLQDEK